MGGKPARISLSDALTAHSFQTAVSPSSKAQAEADQPLLKTLYIRAVPA